MNLKSDTTEYRREQSVRIVYGAEMTTCSLSSLLGYTKMLGLEYKLTPSQGCTLLQVFGPNKVLEFEIIKDTQVH